ncbi:cucumisin-like [Cryptomeria japonica]|uniref:cucumisin-like n=1 Tax=Cryptomeria japonica TaxID=3369 RepID=UPI0027DA46BF|nr:cucumisin-like [Cryptomeria japonica]
MDSFHLSFVWEFYEMIRTAFAMAVPSISYLLFSVLFFLIMLHAKMFCMAVSSEEDTKLYVVYMGNAPSQDNGHSYTTAAALHLDMLESVHGSRVAAEESLKYSYWKSFGGFAAMIFPSHVQQLLDMDGVVSVFESKQLQVLTTRSWDFIGFPASAQNSNLDYQSDIIIGVLDTGVWPESKSFNDAGFGPVPSKWRGGCQTTSDFTSCNKKLVGAKFYRSLSGPILERDFLSPRDAIGHGTHTSSTAAGNYIKNASLYGIAQGDARGGVPGARIAIYKVCWISTFDDTCTDADILAAFDDAIYDGVDIISVSLGGYTSPKYFEDSIAIGSFHAMKRGILVANSAGNTGPDKESVVNYSPWSLTVAASTIDRKMDSQLLLGNNISIEGTSLNTYTMEQPWYPLVIGADICEHYSPNIINVKGNIVLCHSSIIVPDRFIFYAGGAGLILIQEGYDDVVFPYLIPTTVITAKQAEVVFSYINSTSSSIAKIQKTTTPKVQAPIVASFSSRGYNPITFDILKPDITAPGVNILASWSKNDPLTHNTQETRFPEFNIISGTSMSTPHIAGAAGFVKSHHNDWSATAIKSALMTTAFVMDRTLAGNGDAEFGYGVGQINPIMAINPGLVYDAIIDDYINFLCREGYNDTTLRLVTGDFSSCDSIEPSKNGGRQLNYPSIMVVTIPGEPIQAIFPRMVTNVGLVESTYKASVSAPSGIDVIVEPDTLSFSSLNQKLSYNVTIKGGSIATNTLLSGSLTWSYANYTVRSPIAIYAIPT